jgi:hypothetical protein
MNLYNIKTYSEISEAVRYHVDNELSITESVFRIGSNSYADFVCEVRKLWYTGKISLSENDQFIVENLKTGEKAIFQKRGERDKQVVLDSPKRLPKGEKKKFHVYRDSGKKTDNGEIVAVEIQWGDPNLSVKNCDDGASKSFRARHQCTEKTLENDGMKAGWWACNVHMFWKELGLECDNPW